MMTTATAFQQSSLEQLSAVITLIQTRLELTCCTIPFVIFQVLTMDWLFTSKFRANRLRLKDMETNGQLSGGGQKMDSGQAQ